LLPSGPDPWVIMKDGYYYYTNTTGSRLVIWKTKDISKLASAERKTVWVPPAGTAYSREIWAPELHFIRGKWYMYFAADDGQNTNHRMYVIENTAGNPLEGTWTFKGKVADPSDKWA
jgi:GH43 family beta-xylosidase